VGDTARITASSGVVVCFLIIDSMSQGRGILQVFDLIMNTATVKHSLKIAQRVVEDDEVLDGPTV
jgi:hypothetical protein